MIKQLGYGLHPEEAVEEFLHSSDTVASLRFDFAQYYVPSSPSIELLAILFKDDDGLGVLLTDKSSQLELALDSMPALLTSDDLRLLATRLSAPFFNVDQALLLSPIAIAKPWGQEIWYTGIEARGQSNFSDGVFSVPIPWLLALLPKRLLGAAQANLNLLKILDPLPEPVYGDLYFELHEEKQEVYVVTHVDSQSWPEGEGGIRFGFEQSVREEFNDDDAFRQAYLQAVQDYEQIRREIDQIFDQRRRELGLDLNQPVDVELLKTWHGKLASELQKKELFLREAMNRFTRMQGLCEGDVVKVPCLTPHALQHGVRTVEFQTPVYERKILAFGQKVLTQERWDTQEAVGLMSLRSQAEQKLTILEQQEGLCRELVVSFDDFQVQRITLDEGVCWQIPSTKTYQLLIVVSGMFEVGANRLRLNAEQAVLLPVINCTTFVQHCGPGQGIVLLSQPLGAI